ncbi:MAG: NYN domain-containing protein, partial [Youngiibacter sp.]|nr:NYN domain-containing protein [Youngiibacter sp.]
MRTVFIDGYNVINSWQELKDLEFGIAREKLIELMVNYGSFYDSRVVVVVVGVPGGGGSELKERICAL